MITHNVSMLHTDQISLQTSYKDNKKRFVRIVIGGHMFFDSPETTPEVALTIYDNLLNRKHECDIND